MPPSAFLESAFLSHLELRETRLARGVAIREPVVNESRRVLVARTALKRVLCAFLKGGELLLKLLNNYRHSGV